MQIGEINFERPVRFNSSIPCCLLHALCWQVCFSEYDSTIEQKHLHKHTENLDNIKKKHLTS